MKLNFLFFSFLLLVSVASAAIQVGNNDNSKPIVKMESPATPVNISSYNVTSADYWGTHFKTDYNLLALATSVYNFTIPWASAPASNNIDANSKTLTGVTNFTANGTVTLGYNGIVSKSVHILHNLILDNNLDMSAGGSILGLASLTVNSIILQNNIDPETDNLIRAGSPTKRFIEVWSYNGNFSQNVTAKYFFGDGHFINNITYNYNQTGAGGGTTYEYNQTFPAQNYTDAIVTANNNSWTKTYNATYEWTNTTYNKWWFNQSNNAFFYNQTVGFPFNYNQTAPLNYNQTKPAMTYCDNTKWNITGNQQGLSGTKAGSYNINTSGFGYFENGLIVVGNVSYGQGDTQLSGNVLLGNEMWAKTYVYGDMQFMTAFNTLSGVGTFSISQLSVTSEITGPSGSGMNVGTTWNLHDADFLINNGLKVGTYLNVTGNVTIDNLIRLKPIIPPSCNANSNGTIARNSTNKLMYCDGIIWNALY